MPNFYGQVRGGLSIRSIYFGRITPQKGLKDLLVAFSKIIGSKKILPCVYAAAQTKIFESYHKPEQIPKIIYKALNEQ
jgi:glycosyltransferase involved in cell wall biosynthesis